MACRGVHFALSPEQEARLLSAAGDDAAVVDVIQEDIESSWDEEWLCETDKAWDAIHRCLTDGELSDSNGTPPLSLCVLGGRQLHAGEDYYISLVSAGLVDQVATAIAGFSRAQFDAAYSTLSKTSYDGPVGDEDREYTWAYLEDLKPFFRKAAVAGRSVVFTVDQ